MDNFLQIIYGKATENMIIKGICFTAGKIYAFSFIENIPDEDDFCLKSYNKPISYIAKPRCARVIYEGYRIEINSNQFDLFIRICNEDDSTESHKSTLVIKDKSDTHVIKTSMSSDKLMNKLMARAKSDRGVHIKSVDQSNVFVPYKMLDECLWRVDDVE